MKVNLNVLKNIGIQNDAQKAVYLAHCLKTACLSSPPITLSAAIPAIPAKAAVIAQTAKPARAASLAIAAAANTVGYGFGEIYLNSPAYPVGTAIPAIAAKPASTAVVGVPAVVAVAAVPAVITPDVKALPGWEDAIKFVVGLNAQNQPATLTVTADLPYYAGAAMYGSNITKIAEITPPTLVANKWVGTEASVESIEYAIDATFLHMEEMLFDYGYGLETGSYSNEVRMVAGKAVPVKRLEFMVYVQPTYEGRFDGDPRLDQISASPINPGS